MRKLKTSKLVRILFLVCCAAAVFGVGSSAQQGTKKALARLSLKIMTYNLKFADPNFKPVWEIRRDMQVDLINKYSPDVLGTQEGLKEQIDYLMDHLPNYVAIGEGRKGGDDDEHMAIFYRRDRLRLREMGSFQLSDTPARLGSGPSVNPRMVTWARFAFINRPAAGQKSPHPSDYRDHWEDTKEFYVFNTHFFVGRMDRAKLNSARLILEKISALDRFGEWIDDRPVFLAGDFNSRPDSDVYRTFIGDGKSGDLQHLKDSLPGGQGIDWILYKGDDVTVTSHQSIDYKVGGQQPSDHQPVLAEFSIGR